MPRSLISLTILLITIPIGLAVRFLPLHLPWFLYKYLGSTLWAAALYWFLATLLPKLRPQTLAALAIPIAILVELTRLIPIAPIDAFRLTLPGRILLGRYFSIKNIARLYLRHHPLHSARSTPLSRTNPRQQSRVSIVFFKARTARAIRTKSVKIRVATTPNPSTRDTL